MKGVVMELGENHVTILKKNGEFVRRQKNGGAYRVGQEIALEERTGGFSGSMRRLTALAASLLIFVGAGMGAYAYYTPKGYVDVDINPGIEMAYNRFDKVIKATWVNPDGETVLRAAGNLKNKDVGSALERVLEAAEEEGYLTGAPDDSVYVFVSGRDQAQNRIRMENIIRNHQKEKGMSFTYNIDTQSMEKHNFFKEEAEALGITPGKLNLLKKVYGDIEMEEANDGTSAYEEYKDLSVKEIMQSFDKEKGKGEKSLEDPESEGPADGEESGNEESGNEEGGNPGKGNNSGKGNK